MTTMKATMTTWNRSRWRGLAGEIEEVLRDFRGSRPVKQLFWELLGYDRHDEAISLDSSASRFRHLVIEARWLAGHDRFHVYCLTLTDDALDRPVLREICRYFRRRHRHFAVLFGNAGQTDWHLAYLVDDPTARQDSVRFASMRIGHREENVRRQAQAIARLRAYDDDDEPVELLELIASYDEVFHSQLPRAEKSRRATQGVDYLIEEMSRHALLAARQERALLVELDRVAHQVMVQNGKRTKTFRVPNEGQERRYLEVRDKLILHNMRLCFFVAKRYATNQEELQDLFQEGVIGLHRAIDLVDPGRGLRFTTYAYQWIRQAALRWVQQSRQLIRIPAYRHELPRDQRPGIGLVSLDDADCDGSMDLVDPSVPAPSTDREELERNQLIGHSLRKLPERYASVVVRRFGLNGTPERTLNEIGESMGLTRERVRQIEAKALDKLRNHLEPFRESLK
jgi:RNA polymerase primary sigma factor